MAENDSREPDEGLGSKPHLPPRTKETMQAGGWFWAQKELFALCNSPRHKSELGTYGIAVYAAISSEADKSGRATLSLSDIEAMAGATRPKVIRVIKAMESIGMVEVIRCAGGDNTYILADLAVLLESLGGKQYLLPEQEEVVNEVYRSSKHHLPQVVNEVYRTSKRGLPLSYNKKEKEENNTPPPTPSTADAGQRQEEEEVVIPERQELAERLQSWGVLNGKRASILDEWEAYNVAHPSQTVGMDDVIAQLTLDESKAAGEKTRDGVPRWEEPKGVAIKRFTELGVPRCRGAVARLAAQANAPPGGDSSVIVGTGAMRRYTRER